jgi:Cof subfamily protein (haloacid dehalogenase superfamily)
MSTTEGQCETGTIRLVIADVDGTLVTRDKVLTERACEVVSKLRDAGIAFAITSGRPPRGMSMLIEPLYLTTPIAAFNGGMFIKPDISIIDQHVLPPDVAVEVVRLIKSHGLDVWVYRGPDWFVRQRHGPHVDREEWTVKFPPIVVSRFDDVLNRAAKIVGVSDDLEAVARCEADARQKFGDHVSAARSQPYYLDVTHPQANKGTVVRKLSQWLDVPAGQIATIGDMPNDVLMFALSGLSIAMGNASREVQRAARRVTTSNEEEGFANAIECFILCERDAALAGVPHASLDRSEGEHHDSSRSGDSQLVRQG